MIKAVLDTNLLVSAMIVDLGKSARLVRMIGAYQPVICKEILTEVEVALHRPRVRRKYTLTDMQIDSYLESLRISSQFITVHNVENIIPQDPPDNWVLACAVEGAADYLVSGNRHLLVLKEHRNVSIITPAQFLDLLTS